MFLCDGEDSMDNNVADQVATAVKIACKYKYKQKVIEALGDIIDYK